MSDPGKPVGPPQFIVSVLRDEAAGSPPAPDWSHLEGPRRRRGRPRGPRSPGPRPSVPAPVHPSVAAHGYVEPQCPPGTDPRLWCSAHHCVLRITRAPDRRLWCPRCLPAAPWRYNQPFGLRCARQGCGRSAQFELWNVPVCSPACVARIGDGCPVRLRAAALRVIAYESNHAVVVLAFFRNPTRSGDESMIRIHWWFPSSQFARITLLRRPRLAKRYQSGRDLGVGDEAVSYFLVRLARAQAANARGVIPALVKWRAGKGPRPWVDTTLTGILERAAAARAEHRARRADARRTRRSESRLPRHHGESATTDSSESPPPLPARMPAFPL